MFSLFEKSLYLLLYVGTNYTNRNLGKIKWKYFPLISYVRPPLLKVFIFLLFRCYYYYCLILVLIRLKLSYVLLNCKYKNLTVGISVGFIFITVDNGEKMSMLVRLKSNLLWAGNQNQSLMIRFLKIDCKN